MSLISYLTRIHFAEHVLDDALEAEMARLASHRPLVVVDPDGRAGDGATVLDDALPIDCSAVWCDVQALDGPMGDGLDLFASLAERAREARADVILAFGGRSSLSVGRRLAGASGIGLPMIAVPTTTADLGLAPGTVLPHRDRQREAVPAAILCDPCLTYGLGPQRTAAFGFDALTHCIEAFLAPGYNPPADGIALEGIYRIGRYLEAAVAGGTAPEPRREVMAAALNGALAGQKGLGGVEALARAIEAESIDALPHGRLHASVLPGVLSFNAPAVGDRYGRIVSAMGAPATADPITALTDLGARLGLPDGLGHLGLGQAALRRAAVSAAADHATQTNPRHVTEEDYLALLTQAT